ncbi:MAG: hypothetical protein B7Z15_06400, partial [Rhizobiales bacterium 32-66-8]
LCVANLSQTLQAVELDLSEFDARVPVEMGGGTAFPPIGRLPYLLTIPAYGFFSFNLSTEVAEPSWHAAPPEQMPEFETLVLRGGGLTEMVTGRYRSVIEKEALPQYIGRRRWFASRNEPVGAVRLAWAMSMPRAGDNVLLTEIEVDVGGRTEHYMLPLAIAWEDQNPSALALQLALTRVREGRRVGYLTDALTLDPMAHALVRGLRSAVVLPLPDGGELQFLATPNLAEVEIPTEAQIHRIGSEQTNSTLVIEDSASLKLVRRTVFSLNPEAEMARHLTAQGYANAAPLLGEVVRRTPDSSPAVLALLFGYVRNQGDAWNWTLDQVRRAITVTTQAGQDSEQAFEEQISGLIPFIRAVGRRLGEFHEVLARPSADAAFAPQVARPEDAEALAETVRTELHRALAALVDPRHSHAADMVPLVEAIAQAQDGLSAAVDRLAAGFAGTSRIRIHGDCQLSRVLVSGGDAFLLDAGANPDGRRDKASAMQDVATLLRSIASAAATLEMQGSQSQGLASPVVLRALVAMFRTRAERAFLSGYLDVRPLDRPILDLLVLKATAEEISADPAVRPGSLDAAVRGLHALAVRLADAPDLADAELESAGE